jgi:ADP-ribosylglycohydrolase
MTAGAIREKYGILTGFVSDQAVGTDDTDFTLFNAYILLEHGVTVTPGIVEQEWRDKLLSGKYHYRPGGFSDVISTRNLQAGLHAPHSGAFNHQMWSDGVAMAISAAGIACPGDPQQAAHVAAVLGCVSNARDGIYTAQAVAAAISMGMAGTSPEAMFEAGLRAVPPDSWTSRVLERAREAAAGTNDLEDALVRIDQSVMMHWWPWADLATEAVPAAMAVFLAARGEFTKAVPAGIRLGRDADTIGAIVGSLAGAYQGVDAIPADWRARVQASTGQCVGFIAGRSIEVMADGLCDQAIERGAS